MGGWGSIFENISFSAKLKARGIFFLGHFHIYQLKKRPIFIFANRRGGSTLLAQMIASQPGVDLSGEPLNLWRYSPYFERLPHPPQGCFIHLTGEDEQKVHDYFEALLSGRLRGVSIWNPFSPLYSFRVERLVVKLLGANTLIDWFDHQFNLEIIYLLRHPIPVALSALNLKWGNNARAYLENEYYREVVLGKERAKSAEEVFQQGSPLQKYVLEWCLENLYPLQVYKRRSWLVLTYEEIVSRPYLMSKLICSRLKLPNPEKMTKTVFKPSRTTFQPGSKQTIMNKGPGSLVARWLQQVNSDDLLGIQKILDFFEIRVYQAENLYPAGDVCHFGSLESDEKGESILSDVL